MLYIRGRQLKKTGFAGIPARPENIDT